MRLRTVLLALLATVLMVGVASSAGTHFLFGNPEAVMSGYLVAGTGTVNPTGTVQAAGNIVVDDSGANSSYGKVTWNAQTAGGTTYGTTLQNPITQTANYTMQFPIGLPAGANYMLTATGTTSPLQLAWTAQPAGMSHWHLAGSTGNEQVDDNEVVTVAAGSGILTTPVTATNTVTINTVWSRSGTTISPATAGDGATISGAQTGGSTGGMLVVTNTANGPAAQAINAYATGTSSSATAVKATTDSTGGHGVEGYASAATGATAGVWGGSNSSDNAAYGIYASTRTYLGTWADLAEQVADPAASPSGVWRLFSKSTGLFYIDDAGNVTGPLGPGGSHALLSATHTDTSAASPTRGDIIAAMGASPKWTAVAKGALGDVLTMGANEPGWSAPTVYAPTNASYVTVSSEAGLSAESVLTAGTGITLAPSAGTLTVSTTGITTIASGNLTGTAVSIANIPANYGYLVLQINGASSDTATRQVIVRVDSDNGASYDSTSGNYTGYKLTGTTITNFSTAALASLIDGTTVTAASTSTATVTIFGYQGGPNIHAEATFLAGLTRYQNFADFIGTTAAINAIQIAWNGSGSFDAGTYALYGCN